MTKADIFRAMTDEELAEALCLISCGLGPIESTSSDDWLAWVKSEAD